LGEAERERSSAETKTNDLGSRPEENRSRTACEMGQGSSEESCLSGDFRDEESAPNKFGAFLVVGSKRGDTLSLFEPKN
jgi:hypothetical protein